MKTRKILPIILLLMISQFVFAQVAINTDASNPNSDAMLDVKSNDKGMLIPRLSLTGTTNASPLANHVAGMLVYNSANTGDVTPGFYYNDGSKWVRIGFSGESDDDWTVNGNDMYSAVSGNVGIGTSNPTTKLHLSGGNTASDFSSATIALGYSNTGQFPHFIHTRHNSNKLTGNAIDFYTGDKTANGVFPTNAIHGMTIENGKVGIGTTSPNGLLDVDSTGELQFLVQASGVVTDPYNLGFDGNNRRITFLSEQGNYRQALQFGDITTDTTLTMFGIASSNDQGNTWFPRFVVQQDGKVGIGTTDPLTKLTITGDNNKDTGPIITLYGSGTNQMESGRIRMLETNSNGYMGAYMYYNAYTNNFHIGMHNTTSTLTSDDRSAIAIKRSSRYVGLSINPQYRLDLPNDASASGRGRANAWVTYSDSRLKTNQIPIDYGLETILKLQPKRYDQHSASFKEGRLVLSQESNEVDNTVGFIAQELYKVVPEATYKPKDESNDLWAVDYEKIIPILVKAVQELKAENDSLKARLDVLEN